MKTYLFILTFLITFFSETSHAVPQRMNRDLKLPSQQQVEKQTITNPAASSANNILNIEDGGTTTAARTVSTFLAQPDVPRNIVITPGNTTGDIEACDVVVAGTNILGRSISETFTFTANQSTAVTGAKAFKTISSITWPANCESGTFSAVWAVGVGEKLGVKYCMDQVGHILFSTLNGSKEATAPTMVVDNDEVEKNTADYVGTMNSSNDFELFFFQNFRCQ